MQVAIFTEKISDLSNQNEQLKVKYKKSLQELMQILSINKTIKEHIDRCPFNQTKINELQYKVQDLNLRFQMQKIQLKEVVGIKSGLEARVSSLQISNKTVQSEKQRLKNQLGQSLKKLKKYQDTRKQRENQQPIGSSKTKMSQQMQRLKGANEKLGKTVLKYKGIEQQNISLHSKIGQLQQEIKLMNIQWDDQTQKWRNKILAMENQVESIRFNQLQRTRQIQSKYSVLQAQISNYQHIESYIQESKRIEQDELLFNSIQSQIQKINQNISAYQIQNSSLIAKSRQEGQIKLKTKAQMQSQLQKYKLESQHYKNRVQNLQMKLQEMAILEQQLKTVSAQKQELLEKNNVLQAFMITQKHRVGQEVTQKIEEFERNIHLLLQQDLKNLSNLGGLQQIIILKGYVNQLSQLLQAEKKKVDKLKKKNEQIKIKLKQIENQFAFKTTQVDKKIANYQHLIEKQYALLEEKVLQTQNMGNERDYSHAISKYEEKMLKMSDEIIKLKRKNQSFQQNNKTKVVPVITQQKFQRLNNVAANLQTDLQRIQMQNRQLFEENRNLVETLKQQSNQAKLIIQEKECKIAQIISKQTNFELQIKSKQHKINQYIEMIKSYEKQMKALHDQLQQHIATNNYLHDKYKDADKLLEQVENLELQVRQLRNSQQAAIDYETAKLLQHLQQLQSKINLQTQQIDAYKQENTYIYTELQSCKQKKQSILMQHQSVVTELTNKIRYFQEELKEHKTIRMQSEQEKLNLKSEYEKLKQENKQLNLQVQSLREQIQTKRLSFESQINSIKSKKQESELHQSTQQLTHKSSKQIKQLNSKMLSLRTQNLAMKNELQEKQAIISELKHQIYTRQLKNQKQKSRQNLHISKQQNDKNNQYNEKLLVAFTLISTQLEAIKSRQPNVDADVQTFVDCVIQKDIQHQAPEQNITSLDYKQHDMKNKINIVAQPLNLEVQTSKSIQTINDPASVIDSTWRQQFQKIKQKQHVQAGTDYHGSAGSFRMIKLLKQSLKSIEGQSVKKQKSFIKQ